MDRLKEKVMKIMNNAKRNRNEKKIRDKIGFEYKDRKKVW